MDFISGLYSLYLKDRAGEIYDNSQHASDIQSEQLSNLLLEAVDTEWGKKYDFKSIYSYQEYRERLPVIKNSDMLPHLARMRAGEANILWPGLPKEFLDFEKDAQIPIFVQSIEEIFLKGIECNRALFAQNHPDNYSLVGNSAHDKKGDGQPYMNELNTLIRNNEPFISSILNLPKRVETEYQASYVTPEGYFGIQDKPNDSSYLLLLDLSTFFEFIPVENSESAILPLEDVAINTDYQLVVTNCNGLWRCCSVGPLLRFVSVEPYRFILL